MVFESPDSRLLIPLLKPHTWGHDEGHSAVKFLLSYRRFKGQPAVSVKIAEQYFRNNFSGLENDFILQNGFYETTYQQDVLNVNHDDTTNGEL